MKSSSQNSNTSRKAVFSFHGVKVSFNSASATRDPERLKSFDAFRALESLDEDSQVRLSRRFLPFFKAFFADCLNDDSHCLRYIAPKTRALLSAGLTRELLAKLPEYWTPEDRTLWRWYVKLPVPRALRGHSVRFKGITFENGVVFQTKTNMRALNRHAQRGETFYDAALRLAGEAAKAEAEVAHA